MFLVRQDCISTQNKDLLGGKILLEPVDPVKSEGLEIHSPKETTNVSLLLRAGAGSATRRMKFLHARSNAD